MSKRKRRARKHAENALTPYAIMFHYILDGTPWFENPSFYMSRCVGMLG